MLVSQLSRAHCASSSRDEDGQGLAEYALILALIAIVAIVALIFMGSQISDKLSVIGSSSSPSATDLDGTHQTARPDIRTGRFVGLRRAYRANCRRLTLVHDLANHLAMCDGFLPILPMVLALWYSRAAFRRCYSGATCHTTSRGDPNLKRSNRLVLLIGVFLAVVAFVAIAAPDRQRRRRTDRQTRSADRSPDRHRGQGHPARRDRHGGHADDPERSSRASASRRLQDAEPVIGQIARAPDHHGRPAQRPTTSARPRRHACGTIDVPPACARWPSRSTRSPASARSSRPVTTSTWSSASPATSSRS